jgi:SAM-dependent methyltransferase
LGDGDGRFLAKLVEQNRASSPPSRDGACRVEQNSASSQPSPPPLRDGACRIENLAIDYVDLSLKMLEFAKGRAGTDRVTYHQADALTIPLPTATYDLIVTHFFLDCLDEAEMVALVEKIARAASPRARWIVSEFRDRSAWTHAIVSVLYFFFRITAGLRTRKLIDHHKIFVRQGLCLLRDETSVGGLLASELWTIGLDESNLQK